MKTHKTSSSWSRLDWRKSLSSRELEFLTRQLATLLEAGLPLDRALSILSEQASHKKAKQIFTEVRAGVREGGSFAAALARHPKEFADSYRAVVAAGELSGHLPQVLAKLAEALHAQNTLKFGLLGALLYPVMVSVVAFLIVMGLMAYVVPQVVGVLAAQKQSLPFLTQSLIVVSDFVSAWGLICFALLAAGVCGFILAYQSRPAFQIRIDRQLLDLPVLGQLVRLSESAKLANMLSMMLYGGVALPVALHHSARALRNEWFRTQMVHVATLVKEGASLARALDATGVFPKLLVQMAATGEQSGRLSQMLAIAGKEFQASLSYRTNLLTIVLEPLLILVMGGLVLLIVLAVMLPLIEMNALIK